MTHTHVHDTVALPLNGSVTARGTWKSGNNTFSNTGLFSIRRADGCFSLHFHLNYIFGSLLIHFSEEPHNDNSSKINNLYLSGQRSKPQQCIFIQILLSCLNCKKREGRWRRIGVNRLQICRDYTSETHFRKEYLVSSKGMCATQNVGSYVFVVSALWAAFVATCSLYLLNTKLFVLLWQSAAV